LTNVLGVEMNGGMKKLLIGTGLTIVTGVGGYVMNASSKVEPLVEKTNSIEKQIDTQFDDLKERGRDQKEWNALFRSDQQMTNDKLDLLIKAVGHHP